MGELKVFVHRYSGWRARYGTVENPVTRGEEGTVMGMNRVAKVNSGDFEFIMTIGAMSLGAR